MSHDTGTGLNFVRRIYPPRVFGMALGLPAVAEVLYQQQAPWLYWAFAIFNGVLWPHLAYLIASRSAKPILAEYRNFIADSVFAGIWVPLLSFNLLPSLVLMTMASMDNMTVGGLRLFVKGLVASLISMLLAWGCAMFIVPDYTLQLEPNLLILIATAPIMVFYPLSMSRINFSLSRRLARQREELERINHTDNLSGLNNRHFWEASVCREYERHKRSGAPLSLIMIDIDHFKRVNDEYGHMAGDEMIREISKLFIECARTSDIVGRYGGEEFAVVLPDTKLEDAMLFAERMRLAVQFLSVQPYRVRCTISLGVAEVNPSMYKYQQLIELADQALYQAKRNGRNIAVAYEAV